MSITTYSNVLPTSLVFPTYQHPNAGKSIESVVYTIAFLKKGQKVLIFNGFTGAINNSFLTIQVETLLGSQLFLTYPLLLQCKIILYLNDNY